MRITILNQFFVPDASPTAHLSASLAHYLAERGDQVQIICGAANYTSTAATTFGEEPIPGCKVLRLSTPRFRRGAIWIQASAYAVFYIKAAVALVVARRQDAIICLTTPPFIVTAAIPHKILHRRTALVLWNMDCYPQVIEMAGRIRKGGILSALLRAINLVSAFFISHIIALDGAMSQELMRSYATVRRRIPVSVIPNWEPKGLFGNPLSNQRRNAASTEGPYTVLYLGNAGIGHEFDTVLDAASVLRGTDVQFKFVGGGARWSELADGIRRRRLECCELSGYVDKGEVGDILSQASLSLITLQPGAAGLISPSKLHSSLAVGVPILYIGPSGCNVDEAIGRYRVGYSLRNGDVDGVVRCILACRAMGIGESSELRKKCREAFESSYCDGVTLPQMAAVLNSYRSPGGEAGFGDIGAHSGSSVA